MSKCDKPSIVTRLPLGLVVEALAVFERRVLNSCLLVLMLLNID